MNFVFVKATKVMLIFYCLLHKHARGEMGGGEKMETISKQIQWLTISKNLQRPKLIMAKKEMIENERKKAF